MASPIDVRPPDPSRSRLWDEFRFFRHWLRHPGTVGAVWPTGRALASAMATYVPLDDDRPVLELGPGTGAVTRAMLERGVAPQRIVSVEYSREFHDHLVRRFPGVNFIHGDAFDLAGTLGAKWQDRFCAALSGLPLLNFPRWRRAAFVADTLSHLERGAPLVQFTYGPHSPAPPQPGRFTVEATDWITRNVPPAHLFIYRTPPEI